MFLLKLLPLRLRSVLLNCGPDHSQLAQDARDRQLLDNVIIAIHAQLLSSAGLTAAVAAFATLTAQLLQVELGDLPQIPLNVVFSINGAIIRAFRVARSRPKIV